MKLNSVFSYENMTEFSTYIPWHCYSVIIKIYTNHFTCLKTIVLTFMLGSVSWAVLGWVLPTLVRKNLG